MNANFQMLEFPGVHKVNREIPKQKTQNKKGTREMKIPMNRIKCEADRAYNKADDMHLLASIKSRIGQNLKPLLQPIALKKLEGDPDFDYVVEDGRRRFLALVKLNVSELEMGQDCILIDGDSEVNAYVANQHTNLSLAEEIKKLYSMREKFTTIEALAVEIGHSPTWVARRLNLLNLSELWKKAMAEKTFGYMTVAHYETIATFPPTIQDDIFDYIRGVDGRELKNVSIRKFSETLYENFATLLSTLPWKEDGCGECPACMERKNTNYLFANLIPEPRCMNREYLERKRKEYVAELAAKEPKTILVSQKYKAKDENAEESEDDPLANNTVLGPGDWREAENPAEGTPAIIADGPRAGTKIIIQKPKAAEDAPPKQTKTLAERKAAKTRQRKRKAIETMIQAIKDNKTVVPERNIIYLMAACKGTRPVCGSYADFHTKKSNNPLKLPDQISSFSALMNRDESDKKQIDQFFWKTVCENIITELNNGQSGPEEPKWAEAGIIASLIDFDLDKALKDAVAALPDPKSWEALEKKEQKELKEAA